MVLDLASGAGTAKNIDNSPAYQFLDELQSSGTLTPAQVEMYKAKYAQLHDYVLKTYALEKAMVDQSRKLNTIVYEEGKKIEKLKTSRYKLQEQIKQKKKNLEDAHKELQDCEERDTLLQYEHIEKKRENADLSRQVEQMQQENQALVQPQIQKITERINSSKEETARTESALEHESARQEEFTKKVMAIKELQLELEDEKVAQRSILSKLQNDPERIRKQADVVEKAGDNLRAEKARINKQTADCEAEIKMQEEKQAESRDVLKDLERKLELHRGTISKRQQDADAVRKGLEFEKLRNRDLLAVKSELDIERKSAKESLKMEVEQLARTSKDFETKKRLLKKKMNIAESARLELPGFKATINDMVHLRDQHRAENRRLKRNLKDLKQDVDIAIADYLQKDNLEKEKKEQLEMEGQVIKDLERQIAQWQAEEMTMNKQIGVLSAQREIKAREASKALQMERNTKEDLKIKELVILDLGKKYHETNNHLKEFSVLYDVVKKERNKYVNAIQMSSQALAEMKEKIKILQNEVEILRNETLAKDRALNKERMTHQKTQAWRDQLRLECNKCNSQYRKKQEQVEQQIVEIDKLNSVINNMEKDMLRLKKQYELGVEARNFTGVSLIDRNDELCILYEKANIQEETLKKGGVELRLKDEEFRRLKIAIGEMQRKIEVTRKQIPKLPEFAAKILQLQRDLKAEREKTEACCKWLENPKNTDRWRGLGGDDPDSDQLKAKIQVLEERLNDKKEQMLEKELVLEEVTALAEKLRSQATQGRKETLELAKSVNEFQSKIKDTTRKMMATVSELSMYQATAMKLQQEKHDREMELQDMRWCLEHGEPPTDGAEQEWIRSEQDRVRREEARMHKMAGQQAGGAGGFDGGAPSHVTRTTAEPRPNAYIPDDIGIPKPYGKYAPFKPQEAGSTMRHTRAPVQREIEI